MPRKNATDNTEKTAKDCHKFHEFGLQRRMNVAAVIQPGAAYGRRRVRIPQENALASLAKP